MVVPTRKKYSIGKELGLESNFRKPKLFKNAKFLLIATHEIESREGEKMVYAMYNHYF